MAGFIWGENGQKMTPQQVERQRLAAALMSRDAQATTPVASPFAGLNRALQGYISGRDEKRATWAENEGLAGADAAIAGLGGYPGGTVYNSSMGGQPAPVADPRFPIGVDSVAPPNEMTPGGLAMGAVQGGSADAVFRAELLAGGLPEHVVDGIMMNAADESAFNPTAVGDNGAAFGLLQWNGPRKRALEQFAAQIGGNPADPAVQAKFTLYELNGPESAAMASLMGAQNAGEAGAIFVNQFERPAEEHRARREAAYLGGSGMTAGGNNVTMSASNGGASGGTDLASLLALQADPWVAQKYGGVVDALMGQAVQQRDPLYQAQLAAAQAGPGPNEFQQRAQAAAQFGLSGDDAQMFALTGQLPSAPDPFAGTKLVGDNLIGADGQGGFASVYSPPPEVDPFAGTKLVGGDLVAPDGKGGFTSVYTPPPNPEVPTTKNVKLQDGSEVMVQWNPATQVWDAAPIPQGGTTGAGAPVGDLTEAQAKTTLFQTLQNETAPVLAQIESIWDPANVGDAVSRATPIAGNFFKTEEGQIYDAGASAWAEGALRISTGAAATEPEIARIKQTYFAQPGDTPNVVAFKKGMREMYSRAISASLGNANEGGATLVLPEDFAIKYKTANPPPAALPVAPPTPSTPKARKKYNPATGVFE